MKPFRLLVPGLALALLLAGCAADAATPAQPPEPSPAPSAEAAPPSADAPVPALAQAPEPSQPEPSQPGPSQEPEEGGYFDNALFVGDSIMEGVRQYVAARRQEGEALGTARFLTSTMGISLADLTGGREPGVQFSYKGEDQPLEDIVAEIAPRRVFLLLGLNDLASDPDPVVLDVADHYIDLILQLRSACPGVEFVVITNPPKVASQWLPDYTVNRNFGNELIGDFVDELKAACGEQDIAYVDAYEALRDERGALPDQFCRDGFLHLNHQGAAAVVEALEVFAEGR